MLRSQTKSIVIITPFFYPNVGGVETRFLDICRWLAGHGFPVKVITYQPITTQGSRGIRHEVEGNLEIFRLGWPGGDLFHRLKRIPFLQTVYTASGLLLRSLAYLTRHRNEIHIVHAAGLNGALIARLSCGLLRLKWVVSTHAIYGLKHGALLARAVGWILEGADKIIAISESSRKELMGLGIADDKIIIHTTWVNQEVFRPLNREDCRKKTGLPNNFIILFVGRLREIKGVLLMLEVARALPDLTFVFIGEGSMEEPIRRAARDYPWIYYPGPIPNGELPFYYNAADITIMPSLYEEPFGRVVLESLSCGTPCICSNLGGIVRFLDAGVAYLLTPSLQTIKQAIQQLHDDRNRLEKMAAMSRPYAEAKFSEKNISTLLEAYGLSGETSPMESSSDR